MGSSFNNFTSELTGSIIHESNALNRLIMVSKLLRALWTRWFGGKLNSLQITLYSAIHGSTNNFNQKQKNNHIIVWLVLWLLQSIFYRFMFNPTWLARDSKMQSVKSAQFFGTSAGKFNKHANLWLGFENTIGRNIDVGWLRHPS